jgi:hypothetical protein
MSITDKAPFAYEFCTTYDDHAGPNKPLFPDLFSCSSRCQLLSTEFYAYFPPCLCKKQGRRTWCDPNRPALHRAVLLVFNRVPEVGIFQFLRHVDDGPWFFPRSIGQSERLAHNRTGVLTGGSKCVDSGAIGRLD